MELRAVLCALGGVRVAQRSGRHGSRQPAFIAVSGQLKTSDRRLRNQDNRFDRKTCAQRKPALRLRDLTCVRLVDPIRLAGSDIACL